MGIDTCCHNRIKLLSPEFLMSESITLTDAGLLPEDLLPGVSHLVTEDDEPLDNLLSEKQQSSTDVRVARAAIHTHE